MTDSTNSNYQSGQAASEEQFFGLLAQFSGPHELIEGCDQAREAGYKKMDAFSPFPVHGIDDAIGIQRTRLPLIVFCVGLAACGLGLFLQYYTNAFHHDGLFPGYPFLISGKPLFSLPANIPVTFEVIVLLSAFAAFFGMWALNGLPRLSNPLFRHPEFRRATSDGFFLFIEKDDKLFDETRTREQLSEWGAEAVDPISSPVEELHVPGYFKLVGLIVASLLLVPPVMVYRAHYTKNPLPRLHVNPDMDRQYRSEAQDISPSLGDGYLFADERAMRKDPPGTIARGDWARFADVEFYVGIKSGAKTREEVLAQPVPEGETAPLDPELDWMEEYPRQIREKLQSEDSGMELFARGKRQFDIYCALCHGYAGYGDGLVSKRGMALISLQKSDWIAAKSLHDPQVVKQPVGRIFDTITNGRGGMGPYRSQITAEDRWAIIFFVKAMQQSKSGELTEVPEDARVVAWEQVDPTAATDSGSPDGDATPKMSPAVDAAENGEPEKSEPEKSEPEKSEPEKSEPEPSKAEPQQN